MPEATPAHPADRPWIVASGASAGGIAALERLVRHLPADLPAAFFVVIHLNPNSTTVPPAVVSRWSAMPALAAQADQPIRAGQVVIAVPDQHLIVNGAMSTIDRGPKVTAVRPSIDVLFRSAALAHGKRVVGVVLSGMLDDGSAGLVAIRRQGGVTMTQTPADAVFGDMPRHAIATAEPDCVGSAEELADAIAGIVGSPPPQDERPSVARVPDSAASVAQEPIGTTGAVEDVAPSPYTCPECHGTLWPQPPGGTGFPVPRRTRLDGTSPHGRQAAGGGGLTLGGLARPR